MESEGILNHSDATIVAADRSKLWHFFAIYSVVALAVSAGVVLVLGTTGGWDFIKLWLLCSAAGSAYALVFTVSWMFTTSRISYRVNGGRLEVWRGPKIRRAVPVAQVLDFEMNDVMDFRHCLTDVAPPPNWPYGVVTVLEGHREKRIILPEIMIWGVSNRDQASATIRKSIGLDPASGGHD